MTTSGISSPPTRNGSYAGSRTSVSSSSNQRDAEPIELIRTGLSILGFVTVPVSGDSMLPTLLPGQRIVLHAADPDTIRPREVVAFRSHEGHLVLHRVHAVDADHLITAGDRQVLFDPPVAMSDVVGVARGIAPRPAPRRWAARSDSTTVDVWLIDSSEDRRPGTTVNRGGNVATRDLPPGWRLHRRDGEGIGVSAAVLDELHAATRARPSIAVTEQAVHSAIDVFDGGLPPDTQLLLGCSYGKLHAPMTGHLVPIEYADVHVRVGPPGFRLSFAETLHRLSALVTPGRMS